MLVEFLQTKKKNKPRRKTNSKKKTKASPKKGKRKSMRTKRKTHKKQKNTELIFVNPWCYMLFFILFFLQSYRFS